MSFRRMRRCITDFLGEATASPDRSRSGAFAVMMRLLTPLDQVRAGTDTLQTAAVTDV